MIAMPQSLYSARVLPFNLNPKNVHDFVSFFFRDDDADDDDNVDDDDGGGGGGGESIQAHQSKP
jgi:hypothetical protein